MSWLRRTGQVLLHVEDSPTRVAAAFGAGVFIAFFPLLGIHTGLALLVAVAFRLRKVAILLGAWVNNPWTLTPMYTAGTLLGCALLGESPASLGAIDWSSSGRAFYASLVAGFRPLLMPFVVGNLVLGAAAGGASYVALRRLLLARARRAAATAVVAGSSPTDRAGL
jgi:uncharacterized protein (DUF2062 family)